jgi:tetratricopeptide (TPR) repeat protein
LVDHIKLLLRLWWQPAAAMGDVLDRGSLLFATLAVIVATGLVQAGIPQPLFAFYTPLLVLAAIYVPAVLLLASATGRMAVTFQRDYGALFTCAAMALSAAQLPLVVAAWTAPPRVFLLLVGLAALFFLGLMFFAIRTVLGVESAPAAATAALSWIPVAAAVSFWGVIMTIFHVLASPFFLIFAFYYLRSEFSGMGQGLRTRQNFRRMLEAAAINPHDGEAQYELGLIHQQRRQYAEAIKRFQNAVAIDPRETDAHFQLGRIAAAQDRHPEALRHLETVLKLDPQHRSHEIRRELGAVYVALGRFAEAERELNFYTDRREYDPEGLYYYGRALEALGQVDPARDAYQRAIEAARTAPPYRRHLIARWSRMAQKQARKLSRIGPSTSKR